MLLTNYGENLLVDFMRGQAPTLAANLSIGLLTAVTDTGGTEVSWPGYARITVPRALTAWAGTQSQGSTGASNGTSHQTSNNIQWDFANAGGAATVGALGIYNGANLLCWVPLAAPIVYANGDPVSFAVGAVVLTLGLVGGLSDYASNRLIDLLFRGVAYTWPSNVTVRLLTSAPSNAGGGSEVAAGGGYVSQVVASSLTAWAGTQGAGTTTASTGTSGETSNNAPIVFPAPTSNWGVVSHLAVSDGAGVGANLLYWSQMDTPRTVSGGGPAPRYNAGSLRLTFA